MKAYIPVLLIFHIVVASLRADEIVFPARITDYGPVPPLFSDLSKNEQDRNRQEITDRVQDMFDDVMKGDKNRLNQDAVTLSQDPQKLKEFLSQVPAFFAAEQGKRLSAQTTTNSISHKARRILNEIYEDPLLKSKKVSLSIKHADVRDVIELISKSIGLNFVIDPEIFGTVGVFNMKDTTASVALRVLLTNNRPPLALIKDDSIWRITTIAHAQEYVTTHMATLESSDYSHEVTKLHYVRWNETFKLQAQKMWQSLCEREGRRDGYYLVFDDESRKVFYAGRKVLVAQFQEFLKEVDIKIPQINIEARIVVADKHFEDSFGFQWSGIYNRKSSVNKGFDFVGVGPLENIQNNPVPFTNLMDWAFNFFPKSWEKVRNTHIPLVFGGKDLNTTRLNTVLNAAENRHEIKTILKPSILTNDKEMAEVLEGEVIPIETIVEESVEGRLRNVTTATYKDVGVQLKVRPQVSSDQKSVLLDIFVENSMVSEHEMRTHHGSNNSSTGQITYPTILTTRSKTKVLLASGQTTMISGLIRSRKTDEKTAIPYISKIPILGWFFQGWRNTDKELQLLIFITPTIVG